MLVRSSVQYRFSYAMQTLAQLVMMGGELLAVLLLIDRFSVLGRWNGGDLVFFFGVMATTFFIVEAFARGITNVGPMIQSGMLDTLLLRPRGILFQLLCSQADPRRFGAIAVGIVCLALGSRMAGIEWTFYKVIALAFALAGGVTLVIGLFMIDVALCFWSVKSIEVVNILTYGGRSACQYPVDIYPSPLRVLYMTIAPFALTTHLPVSYILGKTLWDAPAWAVFVTPLSGAIFCLAILIFFRQGLRRYCSTGS
jgi:ABC-2 type transport system permease protein